MSCAYFEGMLWLCQSQAGFCSLLDANGKPVAYGSDMRRSCMSNAIDLQQWLAVGIK